jgi:lysozyme family protein
MKRNFERSLAAVLKHEGGYSNHPKDPGGATNFGVTQRVYDAWRKNNGKPSRSVKEIEKAEVDTLYYQQYWIMVRGDQLPDGLDYATFDYAVNSGPSKAIKDLQTVLGVKVDGIPGNVTIGAAQAGEPVKTVDALCDRRMAFLRGLSTFSTFGRGWSTRVGGVRATALEIIRGAASLPEDATLPPPQPRPPTVPPPRKESWSIGQVMAWIVGALLAGLAAYFAGFGR